MIMPVIMSLFVFYLHPLCPRPRWICETQTCGNYSDMGPSLELAKLAFRFPRINQAWPGLTSPAQHLF